MKKKILVLGAAGMAGHLVTLYFIERGFYVTACSRKKFPYCENVILDVFNIYKLSKLINENRYDVIINCIGLLNQTCEENKEKAVYVNSFLPHFLCSITRNTQTRIIHMSTDCVFSGQAGPYFEDSLRDGDSFYDRSKGLGEIIDNKNLTFRNSIIGPDMNEQGIGLFNWFMKQSGEINGYKEVLWTGISTITLARAMEEAIKEEITGLYNLVYSKPISKFDLLTEFNNVFKRVNKVNENYELSTKKILINTRKDFSFKVPPYSEMVIEIKDWIISHKELYPHYTISI